MDKASLDHKTKLLASIGLVLIGLLAGVLLVLMADRSGPVVITRQAEAVQVENDAGAPQPVALADSGEGGTTTGRVAELGRLNQLFKQVASRIRPAVVFINVQNSEKGNWLDAFQENDRDFFERHAPKQQSVGSGVLITEKGHIVTNNHVVKQAGTIRVTLADKREYEAEVIGNDPSTDMAVIKIQGENLPAATLGNSDNVNVGEWVLAVGNPFRLNSTVTAGIVSALGRQVNIISDKFRIENFIQTDAAINPGNSGGALVNMNGELVGISTAIATENGMNAGYGFAVPSNLMERVVKDLIAFGEVRRGYLGVEIREIDARAAERLNLEQISGVYLNDIRRGGAADQAGLQSGDVVLSVEGQPVNAPNELQSTVAHHHPGDQLTVQVWREGSRKQYEVELMGREAPAFKNWFSSQSEDSGDSDEEKIPAPDKRSEDEVFELGEWGIGLQPLSDKDQETYGVSQGVYVAYVEKQGPASQAGLPRDVVITEVAGQSVRSVEDVLNALGQVGPVKHEAVLMRVQQRNGRTSFYEIEPPR